MKIWLNDSLVDSSAVPLTADYWPDGFGLFETIKTVAEFRMRSTDI
jgi:hypothetical protein